jgi:oligosaccharyl transferase (archaeosortase A-associated)
MGESRFSSRWLVVILLLLIFGLALYIRIVPIYNSVFVGDNVKYDTTDAYYFARQVDNLANHFPHISSIDPYLNYPNGTQLGSSTFFIYLLAGISWLFGLGSPSAHLVDIVCAYLPAILGALTIIPIYFIGKTLFNRGVGIVAVALFTILPGSSLTKGLLGYTDRDSLVILLTTLFMLFVILAVKNAREKQLTFRQINRQNLSILTKPLIYSVLSGIWLGLGIITWRGSFLFVIIFLAFFVIQSIINYVKNRSSDYLSFVGIVTFLIALLLVGLISKDSIFVTALTISLLIPLVFSGLTWLLRRWKVKPIFYFTSIICLGLAGVGILYVASPSLFNSILDQFKVFTQSQTTSTISEMHSILFPAGYFSLDALWDNYSINFYLSIVSLGVLIYLCFKYLRIEELLFVIWSLVMCCATLYMRRFSPFFAVTVTLLTGYLVYILYYALQFVINRLSGRSNSYVLSKLDGFLGSNTITKAEASVEVFDELDYYQILDIPRNASRKQIKKAHARLVYKYQTTSVSIDENSEKKLGQINQAYSVLSDFQKRAAYDYSKYGLKTYARDKGETSKKGKFHLVNVINIALVGLVIFFLVFFSNINLITMTYDATKAIIPSDAWCSSLAWLKDNTPEPFGDANSYYQLYQTPLKYPETSYGVAAWWDYGYLILRIGHRLPICDPGAGAREAIARLFTAQNEKTANEIANNENSKYIIVDDSTIANFFPSISIYTGVNVNQFSDIYYMGVINSMKPVRYYYPEYYQSLAVRLYIFNGAQFIPSSVNVISYTNEVSPDGVPVKLVKSTKSFSSYQAAQDFIASQTSGNYRIVSGNPLVSAVPLEPLEHYSLVYSSTQSSSILSDTNMPAVKIFEYTE